MTKLHANRTCESQLANAKRTREDVRRKRTDASLQSVPVPTRENPSGNATLCPLHDGSEINFPHVHIGVLPTKSF